jgi:anti-anti-sigma regulatory factor
MALHVRFANDVAIVDNFAWLMNDPTHASASAEVADLLDQGYRNFIFEMTSVREVGDAFLGLLLTLTRAIRKARGEVVLAHPTREVTNALDRMMLEDYWDTFPRVADAQSFFHRGPDPLPDEA